ncbi:MAG: hypothetical protein RR064_04740 [Oscillospiraceae bacterium]
MKIKNRHKKVVAMLSAAFIIFSYISFPTYNINSDNNDYKYKIMARIDFGEMGENI